MSQESFILQHKNPTPNPTLPRPKNAKSSSPEADNKEQLPGLWVLTSSCTHPFITRTRFRILSHLPLLSFLLGGQQGHQGQCCSLTHLPLPLAALLPDLPRVLRQATHPSCAVQSTWHWHCTACTQAKQKMPAQQVSELQEMSHSTEQAK